MHAAAFEAGAGDVLAGGLDDAGGDAKPDGPESGIAHSLAVAGEVVEAFPGVVAGLGMDIEGGEEVVEAALIEFVASLFSPGEGEVGCGSVDGFGDVEQVLFGVEDIDDLDGGGEMLVGPVPDPRGAVAEDDLPGDSVEAAALGFANGAKGEGTVSVSRLATVSMAAL